MTATSATAWLSARIRLLRLGSAGLVVVAWLVGFVALRGRDTLTLAQADLTPVHRQLNHLNDVVGAGRSTNPLFLYFFDPILSLIHI